MPRVKGLHPHLGILSFFYSSNPKKESRRKVEQDRESVRGYVEMAGAAMERREWRDWNWNMEWTCSETIK